MDRKKQGTNTTKHLLELAAFTGSLILCRVRVGDSCAPFGLASMAAAELTGIDPLFAGAGVVVGAFLSGEPLWGVMIAAAAFVLLTRLMKVVVGPVPSSARMLVFLLCEIAVLPFEMVRLCAAGSGPVRCGCGADAAMLGPVPPCRAAGGAAGEGAADAVLVPGAAAPGHGGLRRRRHLPAGHTAGRVRADPGLHQGTGGAGGGDPHRRPAGLRLGGRGPAAGGHGLVRPHGRFGVSLWPGLCRRRLPADGAGPGRIPGGGGGDLAGGQRPHRVPGGAGPAPRVDGSAGAPLQQPPVRRAQRGGGHGPVEAPHGRGGGGGSPALRGSVRPLRRGAGRGSVRRRMAPGRGPAGVRGL